MQSDQYIRTDYTRAEVLSDAVVHAIGLLAALIAVPVLILRAALWFNDTAVVVAATIYGLSVIAMFSCSALYNIFSPPEWKGTFRKLDQSAIYIKMAGSYTPFAVLAGAGSGSLLVWVWATAVLGTSMIVFSPKRLRWASLALYLALGWAGALVGAPMMAAMSHTGFTLVVTAGSIYTIGVLFFLWEGLPFHNTIWHVFVVAGTFVLYAAVLFELSGHAPLL